MKTYKGTSTAGVGYARRLGFPTVNIPLLDNDVSGIYAAQATIGGAIHPAVVYANRKRNILEAHLLDFSGEIKESEAVITLLKKIREDRTFTDEAAMRAAIAKDIGAAHDYFRFLQKPKMKK